MKTRKINYVIVILLTLVLSWSSQQVSLAEEADMKSNVGIGFENSYEGGSSELPETGTDPIPEGTQPEATKPVQVGNKVLPQTGVTHNLNISWIGLAILGMVMIRYKKSK